MQVNDFRQMLRRLKSGGDGTEVSPEAVLAAKNALTQTQQARLKEILSSEEAMQAFLRSPEAVRLLEKLDQ